MQYCTQVNFRIEIVKRFWSCLTLGASKTDDKQGGCTAGGVNDVFVAFEVVCVVFWERNITRSLIHLILQTLFLHFIMGPLLVLYPT